MPYGLVVLRRRIAFAFLRNDMQHFRPAVVFYLAQYAYQSFYVMAVGGSEIADVHTGEDIAFLLAEHGLQTVVPSLDALFLLLVYQVQFLRQLIEPPAPTVVASTRRQVNQILGKTALQRVDSHVIIVQHNQQVVLVHRRVVQPLKSQTSRHSSVTYDGYGVMSYSVSGLTVALRRSCSEAVSNIKA